MDVEGLRGTMTLLSSFDVNDIEPEALLFQTGYLTVVDEEPSGGEPVFRLGYPNKEVRQSLNEHLLRTMTPVASRRLADGARLRAMLADGDLEALEASLRRSSPASPTTGTGATTSPATKATTPACATRTSPPRAWM